VVEAGTVKEHHQGNVGIEGTPAGAGMDALARN
jgi:hypothetical protein